MAAVVRRHHGIDDLVDTGEERPKEFLDLGEKPPEEFHAGSAEILRQAAMAIIKAWDGANEQLRELALQHGLKDTYVMRFTSRGRGRLVPVVCREQTAKDVVRIKG